jgi:S-formylglutathione hydrolase FrmB
MSRGPGPSPGQIQRRRLAAGLALLGLLVGGFLVLRATVLESDEDGDRPPIVSEEAAPGPRKGVTGGGGAAVPSEITITSEAVGADLDVQVLEPGGPRPAEKRPLLVFLHGSGGSEESFVGERVVLANLRRLGARAPVIAFPDGGEGWWHDRASGDWGRYVVREVIPAVSRRFDTDRRRVAIGGISMGGYGAYHLGLEYPRRFCAVGGHSAGLWPEGSEEFPGAFDDRADYGRNDVLGAVERDPDAFGEARVWNDYGDQDWFVAGNEAFVDALAGGDADLTANVWAGGHDYIYWNAHWGDYLRFYADSLADCG